MISQILISSDLDARRSTIAELIIKKGLTNPHPDLRLFEDKDKLGVKESAQIIKFLSLKPHQAKGKVVAITSAQNLTTDAQNALLKILEEPPLDALIVLATDSLNALITTVQSRCQITILENTRPEVAALPEIEGLKNLSLESRFKLIEKLEDKKEQFFQDLLVYFHQELSKNPSQVDLARQLLLMEKYKKRSVNLRNILEYIMLMIPSENH